MSKTTEEFTEFMRAAFPALNAQAPLTDQESDGQSVDDLMQAIANDNKEH